MTKSSYFLVDKKILKERKIFPYHLFIFNDQTKEYLPFLSSNSPLIKEKLEFLEYILNKGGKLAIDSEQKKTFLKCHNINEEDIVLVENKNNKELEEYSKIHEKNLKLLEEDNESTAECFNKCLFEDNFMPLITKARINIMAMSVQVNSTVSMAIKLAEEILIKDSQCNRIVALTYFLAKESNINDDQSMGDLMVAAFLHHIGMTQLDISMSHIPYMKQSDQQQKDYKNHCGLSHHLIKKGNLNITKRSIKLINQHHERYNGHGYPEQTIGTFIDPLALILGLASHAIDFSSGKVVEESRKIDTILKMIKDLNSTLGLEVSFGDMVLESLSKFINKNNSLELEKSA